MENRLYFLMRISLPNKTDIKYLEYLRYNPKYYPFSPNYDRALNKKFYSDALDNGTSENICEIIKSCDYFHDEIYLKLSNELMHHLKHIRLSKKHLRELYIASMNELELDIDEKFGAFLNKAKHISAFNIHNSTLVQENNSSNPQNFTSVSEAIVEYANVFFRYLSSYKDDENISHEIDIPQNIIFETLPKIVTICNKFYGIKNHFDGVLFHNGELKISTEKLFFNPYLNKLPLNEHACVTMTTNQRFNRYEYYEIFFKSQLHKQIILDDTGPLILDKIDIKEGFINYSLRQRTVDDYSIHLDYLVALHDYYPFYNKEQLPILGNLSITKLLQLHTELHLIIFQIYVLGMPENNLEEIAIFKGNFIPKIKETDLKNYLKSVSRCSTEQIETFINLMTGKYSDKINLYATPILKEEDYYYFILVPILKPNHCYLIDYWLEQAGFDLTARGYELEKYIKAQLISAVQLENNKFSLVERNKFSVKKLEEEIDLIIQTKNTIIIGEIKCVKYPMYERDYCATLNRSIKKGVIQVKRKSDFINKYRSQFLEDIDLSNKKIVHVVILNFPVYSSIEIEDVAVVDVNTFLSYFRSGKMITKLIGKDNTEVIDRMAYYSSEDEFCDNLESYLKNGPVLNQILNQMSTTTLSYSFNGLPTIDFVEHCPISDDNTIHESSIN